MKKSACSANTAGASAFCGRAAVSAWGFCDPSRPDERNDRGSTLGVARTDVTGNAEAPTAEVSRSGMAISQTGWILQPGACLKVDEKLASQGAVSAAPDDTVEHGRISTRFSSKI